MIGDDHYQCHLTMNDSMYIRDKLHKLRLNRDVLKSNDGGEDV